MRKFGIEIEAGLQPGANRRDLSAALAAAGLGGQEIGYTGFHDRLWVVKTDASVMGGVEVVSPPLDFDDPEQRGQVDRVLVVMQQFCRTVSSAGIHIHVESRDMTPEQLGSLARTWTRYEDVIYRLASSGWTTIRSGARQYAKPLSETQVVGLAKAKTDAAVRKAYYGSTESYAQGSHGHSSRYHGLNLHSHFYRGTVEFRVFNSSLSAMRIQTYVAMCMALMADAKSGKKRSTNKAVRLGDMAAGRADGAKVFFQFLGVMRYQSGMSLADYRNLKKIWADSKAQTAIPGSNW